MEFRLAEFVQKETFKNFKNCFYQNQLQTFPTDHLILLPCLFPTQVLEQTLLGFLFLSSQHQRKKEKNPYLKVSIVQNGNPQRLTVTED